MVKCGGKPVSLDIKTSKQKDMRFTGTIEAKTDSKGRLFLPAVFRKILQGKEEEQLILKKDTFQDCLVIYPWSVWNEEVDTLRSKLSRWNAAHQTVFRQFVSDVEVVTLDSSGRFLIPKRYLKMAGISQGVVFLGMDSTIEIWAQERMEQPFMNNEDFSRELEKIMNGKDE